MSEGAEREREREKARAVEREGGKGDDGMVSCWMMMSFPLALTWMPCLDAVHTVNGSPARAALTPRPHTAVTPSQLTSRVKSSPIQPNPTPSPAQPPGPFLSLSPSLSLSRALLAPSYFFLLLLLFPLWLPPPHLVSCPPPLYRPLRHGVTSSSLRALRVCWYSVWRISGRRAPFAASLEASVTRILVLQWWLSGVGLGGFERFGSSERVLVQWLIMCTVMGAYFLVSVRGECEGVWRFF